MGGAAFPVSSGFRRRAPEALRGGTPASTLAIVFSDEISAERRARLGFVDQALPTGTGGMKSAIRKIELRGRHRRGAGFRRTGARIARCPDPLQPVEGVPSSAEHLRHRDPPPEDGGPMPHHPVKVAVRCADRCARLGPDRRSMSSGVDAPPVLRGVSSVDTRRASVAAASAPYMACGPVLASAARVFGPARGLSPTVPIGSGSPSAPKNTAPCRNRCGQPAPCWRRAIRGVGGFMMKPSRASAMAGSNSAAQGSLPNLACASAAERDIARHPDR